MSQSSPSSSEALKRKPSKKKPYPIYLGGVAASIAAVVTHPLDVAKVRMQTSQSHSFFQTLYKSVKADGIVKGAYAGLSASLLRQMTYSMVRFGVYDTLKEKLGKEGKGIPAWKLAIAASIAGGAGGLAGNPADVVLVRMIGDVNRPAAEKLNYRHAGDGVVQIVKSEGPLSLFRGLAPNTVRAVLMNASQLATYDLFKEALLKTGYFVDGMGTHFTAGFMAGTVATTICAPFDVLKSRIMNQSGKQGVLQIVRTSFAQEGVRWMFRGWFPAWVRLTPNSLVIFLALEQLRNSVDKFRGYSSK